MGDAEGRILSKGDVGSAFVSGAGWVVFLVSKYVLLQETKQNTNSSGFCSFVLNTNTQKERVDVVIFVQTISNASHSTAQGV